MAIYGNISITAPALATRLEMRLRELVKNREDHGPADKIELAIESIGKNFSRIERHATVI